LILYTVAYLIEQWFFFEAAEWLTTRSNSQLAST